MRRVLAAILLAGALSGAPAIAFAQSVAFRILDEDRLLRESRLGQSILAEIRAAEQALEQENQRISEQLAEEERALTEERALLSPDEFRARADAFDRRVEEIRTERNQRSLELNRFSESEAQRFFDTALPVLVALMNEEGLVAILKPDVMIIGADWLDMTDAAIARLDADVTPDAPAPDAPAPDTP